MCHTPLSMIQIHLFGAPYVEFVGQPILVQRHTARSLLFYLAAQNKPVSRSHLLAIFWPDFSEEKARIALSDIVGKLRRDLPDPSIVQTSPKLITLDLEKVWVDYLAFSDSMKLFSGSVASHEPLGVRQAQVVRDALGLWGGQEIFFGYDFGKWDWLERWRTEQNSAILYRILPALQRLVQYEIENGNHEDALNWLFMALRADEYDEACHKQILEIYLNAGMQFQARQYYESLPRQLELDSAEDLSLELQQLKPRIYKTTPVNTSAQNDLWPVKLSAQISFIGQGEILREMAKFWNVGGAVLLLGEAGSGKTRLAQEVFRRVSPSPRLLIGSCQAIETNMPLSPWVTMLRQAVRQDEWQALDGVWAQALIVPFPELVNLHPEWGQASKIKHDISRAVLIEAIHQLLLLLAEDGPLFLFLDDTQWADETTLAVISYLFNQQFFTHRRGLLVMAARLEDRNPVLDKLLSSPTLQRVRQFELRSLDMEEVNEMAWAVLNYRLPDMFLERLDQDTGGNPFFLLEILQSIHDNSNLISHEQAEHLPLPKSIHDLIQQRLHTLDDDSLEILSTGAVLGSKFSLDLLEKATHFFPQVVVCSVEKLEKARLLQHIDADTPIYGFPHEKIRESLLIGMSLARKRFYHQNIAMALEQYLGEQVAPQAASLAYHYEQAGNIVKAFEYWALTGRHAHRLASFHESLNAFDRAERLISRAPALTDQDLYSLYSIWNDALFQSDQPAGLKRVNQSLLVLGQERQSPLLIGTALSGMSDAYMAENNFEAALQSVEEGLAYVQKSQNDYEMVRTLDRIGVYNYMLNRLPESQCYFQKSIKISRDSIDSLMVFQRSSTYYQLAITSTLSGNPKQGLDYAQKNLEDAIRAYHPYGQVLAYSVMGLAHYISGNFIAGREACRKGMEFEHIQAWRMMGYISSYHGMNAVEMGLLDEAWRYGQNAIEIGRKQGHGEVIGLGYKAIGDLYLRLGATTNALNAFQQGINASGEHFVALENMHRYGYLLYLQGQHALGREYLQRALDISAQNGLWSIHFLGLVHQLEILFAEAQWQEFQEIAQWFAQESLKRLGTDITRFTIQRLNLKSAFQTGQMQTAIAIAEEILPWYSAQNMPWRQLECLRILRESQKALGLDSAPTSATIHTILQHIEQNLSTAPLKNHWQNFKEQILQP